MAWFNAVNSKRCLSVAVTAGVVLSAAVAFGAFAGSANAEGRGWEHRDHRRHHGYNQNWNGGYYRSPPVVYGSPYYYPPPPVVYGPGIGLNFNIR